MDFGTATTHEVAATIHLRSHLLAIGSAVMLWRFVSAIDANSALDSGGRTTGVDPLF